MNLNTLQEFRHRMYHCFGNAKDALFNLVDALSSEAGASSFPELSFSPFFERTWASLYEALEDGQIDAERLRQVFVDFAPLPRQGRSFFWGWIPATCTARRPRPPRIARWFPLPICPRTRTRPALGGS